MTTADTVRSIPVVRDGIAKDGACSVFLALTGQACEEASATLERIPTSSLSSHPSPPLPESNVPWMLLYDVMRVHNKHVMFLQDHFTRIFDSFHTMTGRVMSDTMRRHVEEGIRAYMGDTAARTDTSDAAAAKHEDINVKFIMWVDPTTRLPGGFVIFFVTSFFPPEAWYATGIRMALLFNASRTNPSAKVVQAPLRARAAALQSDLDVFEVLLTHGEQDHYLIPEGSRSNYFLITPENDLLCSAEEDILIGITLKAARGAAVTAGLGAVKHEKLTLRHLLECTAMVMLGTSPGVLPVREIVVFHDAATKAEFERACAELGVSERDRQRIVLSSPESTIGTLPLQVPHPIATKLHEAYQHKAETS